jgi:hypothetical protein
VLCISKACWYDYDFSRLSEALVSHAANRRVLEWTWYDSHRSSQLFRPFGSLRGLQNLTRLALDYTLMTPSSGGNDAHPIHLLDPQGYLPVSLKSLGIADFAQDCAYNLCSRYMQKDSTAAVVDFLIGLVAMTFLSGITLWITMDSWPHSRACMRELPRCMRKILPQLVTRLREMDVDLAVWRRVSLSMYKVQEVFHRFISTRGSHHDNPRHGGKG